jgi:hypothetical protein
MSNSNSCCTEPGTLAWWFRMRQPVRELMPGPRGC